MADGTNASIATLSLDASKANLLDLIDLADGGDGINGLEVVETDGLTSFVLPNDKSLDRPLAVDQHIVLVQADGSVVVLLNGATGGFLIQSGELLVPVAELATLAKPEDDWSLLSEADQVDLSGFDTAQSSADTSVQEENSPVNLPLVGLAISPLLPPTEYDFPVFREEEPGGGSLPDVGITQIAPISTIETDDSVTIRFSDFFDIEAGNAAFGEQITEIGIRVPNLPAGTTSNLGKISGGVLTFVGTPEQFDRLTLTFPPDFSTESRIDATPGDLRAEIFANSNFGDGPVRTFPIRVAAEADLEMTGSGAVSLTETDDPLTFRPSDAVLPKATDRDGSEVVTEVSLDLGGLPPGARVSFDGGATFNPVSGPVAFTGSLADYKNIVVELPADFSTTNPMTTISGTVSARTNEGGFETRPFDVGVIATPDIVLTAPPVVSGVEDGNGGDGSGVTVDLDLNVFTTDIDGSEDATTVTIDFTDLPPGATVNSGTLSGSSWTGTMAEANALELTLPGDYSGRISASIRASNPEGAERTNQVIEIAPAGDVDLTVVPIVEVETDDPIEINPSASWQVSVSDFDPSLPREVLTRVDLTLDDLPPGVVISGVPAATYSYDATLGGAFVFSGSPTDYDALRLVFPADYSTESPGTPAPVLTGTLSATSTEGAAGPVAVELRITPEGDAEIDDTLPDTVPDETDSPIVFSPSSLLLPAATDLDGSESIETLELTVEGLPGDGSFSLSDVSGIPAGATASLIPAADGSLTLSVSLDTVSVGDVALAYAAISIALPADFSTANRSDLSAGTSRNIDLTLNIQTDEDDDATVDLPNDGTVTATRSIEIGFEEDIDLSVPTTITVPEDGGPSASSGTVVDLGIDITIDDADGSETEDATDPRFAASVMVDFTGLPAGSTVNVGTLSGSVWTGTVAEAEALVLTVAGNFSGTINAEVTVTTPEGSETTTTDIVVTPTPDLSVSGSIVSMETDAPLVVPIATGITIDVSDPSERVYSIDFTLPGVPAGTTANDGSGNPVGSFAPGPGGTQIFTFSFVDADGDGADDATGVRFEDVQLVFPADFSTANPNVPLAASLEVATIQGGTVLPSTTATIPVIIDFEGDVEITGSGTITTSETDAPVDIRPADGLTPTPTDADGSEAIDTVSVDFNALPPGTLFSTDGGTTFAPASPTLGFTGTLAEYNNLVVRLPADFSTENPATTLEATVTSTTDEGGTATRSLSVDISAEGDIAISGPGTIALDENDAPGDLDNDGTAQDPVLFRPADAANASATDADGSESVARVDVTITGLPTGSFYSLGGAFIGVPAGPTFSLPGLTPAQYAALTVRLPDDFSTENPATTISGSVTFTTDEAILSGETDTGPNDGVETAGFTVTVASEADVQIIAADITVIEDLGVPIPLNLDANVTDIDGSESITGITLSFSGLPAGGSTTLTDGTVLAGPTATWTGTLAQMQALGVASFPEHFSGIVSTEVTIVTDEGATAGTSQTFLLNVTPVAEPTIVLTVDPTEPQVTATGGDSFSVKEDTSFLLLIDADTPDKDGSESLTRIVIENIPTGWVPAGSVPLSLFEAGAGDIASATMTGTTLTIVLNPGVTDFDGGVRVTPGADDDRDVATILGRDLVATVTAVDTAAGLPNSTATASDATDVNLDAVIDPINVAVRNTSGDENTSGFVSRRLRIDDISLNDTDGSERLGRVTLDLTVATGSDVIDLSDPSQFLLRVNGGGLAGFANITQTSVSATTASYEIVPAGGATDAQFAAALEQLQLRFGENISAVVSTDGTVFSSETRTGDVEIDTSDNFGSRDFSTTVTIRPVAEALLTASVFVNEANFVSRGATSLTQTVDTSDATAAGRLRLKESTADGSGPGQVRLFVGIDAATPDGDGSEEIRTAVIQNVPTAWIDNFLTGTTLDRSALFSLDGRSPISDAEFAKIAGANYNASTGALTLTFVADVTGFEAAIALEPSLYEDYDVNRNNSDRFTSEGDFFGDELRVVVTTGDTNGATSDTASASARFNVDVDPVNNFATITLPPIQAEDVVDAAGGVFQLPIVPMIPDMDGSESIETVVLRNIPARAAIYVTDPDNPGGPKIPALLTEVNSPAGFNTWSLSNDEWLTAEIRGVPLHAAGTFPITVDVVTKEANGGTRVTRINTEYEISPVADGGNPSETVSTDEDTAVRVRIDGNIIDNASNSPGSPEQILDGVIVRNVEPDSFGRYPLFFDGPPVVDPTDPSGYANTIGLNIPVPGGAGDLVLAAAQASNLWVLPGQDSNETITFDVELVYFETIVPWPTKPNLADLPSDAYRVETGTVTVNVRGIADDPVVDAQDASGFPNPSAIDAIFRPTEVVDGIPNSDRIYGYAGFDDGPFLLDSRIRNPFIQNGTVPSDPAVAFTSDGVTPLSGDPSEILVPVGSPGADFDGSETVYYLITGVPAGAAFANASPVDLTGSSYLVSASQLPNLLFVPSDVSEPTYYDMKFTTVVIEDDQPPPSVAGLTQDEAIAAIAALPGGAAETVDFTVVVLPGSGSGGPPCTPDQDLPLPDLALVAVGATLEDGVIEYRIEITPNVFFDSVADLATLPNGVLGNFGLGITLPDGASLTGSPASAVLFDPVTGKYVIDFSQLTNPGDGTVSSGSIFFTPPPHQSSPTNPFSPAETLGTDDPYDGLDQLEYTMLLRNFTCGTTLSDTRNFPIQIDPVVDGPAITFSGDSSVDEDTNADLGLTVGSIDGGERLVGNVTIEIDATAGGEVLDSSGTPLTGTLIGGFLTYSVPASSISGLQVRAADHYSGPLEVRVTATSEDIDGSTASNTATRIIDIIPVADTPVFAFDDTAIDPDTGLPFVDTSASPVSIQAIEDVPFVLSSAISAFTPDMDGSEVFSIVLSGVPDYLVPALGPGAPVAGLVNNGDGSYTISATAYPFLTLSLTDEHARTPDALDPTIPSEIPLTLRGNTFELANADEASAEVDFVFRVRPDADTPTLAASLTPTSGVEDDGTSFTLNLVGTTPDPHEFIDFEVTLPPGAILRINGVDQVPGPGGVYVVDGGIGASTGGDATFVPPGTVTIVAPPDFSGNLSVDVTAVTSDSSVDMTFTDTESSAAQNLVASIAPAPDLVVTQGTSDIVLDEGDDPGQPTFRPADEITIDVTDTDGSEVVDSIIYILNGIPSGTTYTLGGAPITAAGPNLSLSLSEADFALLEIRFPINHSTNGVPLNGSLRATTNEGGDESVSFTVDITPELDLLVSVSPTDQAQTGAPLAVPLGITVDLEPPQPTNSETPETLAVVFSAPLPVGATVSAGVLAADRQTLTLTRGALSPTDFTALIAALAVTLPGSFEGVLAGTVTATSNHGVTTPVAFSIGVNDQPVISGPIDLGIAPATTFTIPFSQLLATASDPDGPLSVTNVSSSDPNVSATITGAGVEVSVIPGFTGPVTFDFDVADAGAPVATVAATATLEIVEALDLVDGGTTVTGPGGATIPLMDDLTGTALTIEFGVGTDAAEAVVFDATSRPYAGIDGFFMGGGNDLVDLTGALSGFTLDMGDGDDDAIGGAGDDIIDGGAGADTLTGGGGADTFVLSTALDITDVISDYGDGADVIDLSKVLKGSDTIGARASYDGSTGELTVDGDVAAQVNASGGGFPPSVEVVFEDASGAQASVVI